MNKSPLIVLFVWVSNFVLAQAPPSYEASLKLGREQLKAGHAEEAVRAFEAAVMARPSDAVALSELGWAQFVAKDYKHAEETTLKAIMRAGSNNKLKSAGWYNMGRIQEARGNKDAAADAYRSAIKVQPSAASKTRLDKLTGASSAPDDPLDVENMEGPASSEAKLCASWKAAQTSPLTPECACDASSFKVSAPYLDGRICTTRLGQDVVYRLLLRTSAGWFWKELASSTELSGRFGTHSNFEVRSAEVRDIVPGGSPELMAHFALKETTGTDSGLSIDEEDRAVVCGLVGTTPACTRPVLEMKKSEGKPKAKLAVKATADGKLEVKLVSGSVPSEEKDSLGAHALNFGP
jgi:tetratricopeptide (TPR) repeat protein